VTTGAERAEHRAQRAEMARRYPSCRWCRKPVTCGQIDGEGVPAHYGCQIPFLQLSKPHRHASTVNPRLPPGAAAGITGTEGEHVMAGFKREKRQSKIPPVRLPIVKLEPRKTPPAPLTATPRVRRRKGKR
jgi:hypothetical protein